MADNCKECGNEMTHWYACDCCGWRADLLVEAQEALDLLVNAAKGLLAAPLLTFACAATQAQAQADKCATQHRWDAFSAANLDAVKARLRMMRAPSVVGLVSLLNSARHIGALALEAIKGRAKEDAPAAPKLVRACAWCWLDLSDVEQKKRVHPLDCDTHGICDQCAAKQLAEADQTNQRAASPVSAS